MAIAMLAVAAGFWLLQVVLSLTGVGEVVSEILGFIQIGLFFFWFLFLGINFFGKNSLQKVGVTLGLDVAELIPFINDVPFIIVQILWLIYITRKEDKEKVVEQAAAAEKAAAEQRAREIQYYAARVPARAQRYAIAREEELE